MATVHTVLVQRWFEEVWNKKREAMIYEMLDPGVRVYGMPPNPDEPIVGPENYVPFWRNLISAVPDIQVIVESTVEDAEHVVARCTVRGTHTGPGLGIAPTHVPIHFTGMVFIHVRDGKFTEGWNNFDFLLFYQQVGLVKMVL